MHRSRILVCDNPSIRNVEVCCATEARGKEGRLPSLYFRWKVRVTRDLNSTCSSISNPSAIRSRLAFLIQHPRCGVTSYPPPHVQIQGLGETGSPKANQQCSRATQNPQLLQSYGASFSPKCRHFDPLASSLPLCSKLSNDN